MAFKMNARSPLMKTLVGAQKNLPEGLKNAIEAAPESPAKNMNKGYGTPSPAKKSKAKVEQDYARNAIADYKKGDKKAAGYEKKKALEVAAGEGK
jgi:hypothetical protein